MSTAARKMPSKSKTPKTSSVPSRGRKEQREPLTPSLSHALGGLNLNASSRGQGDKEKTKTGSEKSRSKRGEDDSLMSPINLVVGRAAGNTGASRGSGRVGEGGVSLRDDSRDVDADESINPFLETSVPLGQPLKMFSSSGRSAKTGGSSTSAGVTSGGVGGTASSRPASRTGSRPSSRTGSRPGSPNKRSKSAHGPKNTVNLVAIEQKDAASKEPTPTPRKRSKSQTNARPRSIHDEYGDRFIADRNPNATVLSFTPPKAGSTENSPAHMQRLASAANLEPDGRILTFHQPPPSSNADPMLAAQRTHVQPLYAQEKAGSSSASGGSSAASGSAAKVRRLPTQPDRVLDAPGILDDYYLNLLSWSARNELAVGLEENTYVWRASTGAAVHLAESTEGRWVTSVDWSSDASRKLRTMTGRQAQVGALSWNNHVLSSGCQDGSIWHHDVRVARHHQGTLIGHVGEVCGLKWRSDGMLLASGGNDNVVNVWDNRMGDSDADGDIEEQRTAKWTKRNHTAAVKALAWCPWQDSLLASGGGTGDATVHFWNTNTGARVASLTTPAQVTSIHFTPLAKEVMTTHGYPTNSIMVHSYPSMTKIGEIKDAHDSRVLYSALSPVGDTVVTGAGDENIKFWKLWEVPPKKAKSKSDDLCTCYLLVMNAYCFSTLSCLEPPTGTFVFYSSCGNHRRAGVSQYGIRSVSVTMFIKMHFFALGASRASGYEIALKLLSEGHQGSIPLRSPLMLENDPRMTRYFDTNQLVLYKCDAMKLEDVEKCQHGGLAQRCLDYLLCTAHFPSKDGHLVGRCSYQGFDGSHSVSRSPNRVMSTSCSKFG
ncbi:related to cell cycle protein p55cdc [Serendipita indica DSM 11827]|uniref:Related to cell cycle protein p55cdc n=1 Tax=Serendipita indica (strain DSM 11827) TaxID=1109443 RepID=G4TFT2_SERID|nr:related to cell cycle protein p55cdc [Serendipita indica DSM 11827]